MSASAPRLIPRQKERVIGTSRPEEGPLDSPASVVAVFAIVMALIVATGYFIS